MRLLTAVESVLQLERERDMRSASSYEGSLLSSEHLVYRSRVCGLTRECETECLTGAILHVHLVKGPSRWFGKRRVLEKKKKISFLFFTCKSGQSNGFNEQQSQLTTLVGSQLSSEPGHETHS